MHVKKTTNWIANSNVTPFAQTGLSPAHTHIFIFLLLLNGMQKRDETQNKIVIYVTSLSMNFAYDVRLLECFYFIKNEPQPDIFQISRRKKATKYSYFGMQILFQVLSACVCVFAFLLLAFAFLPFA